MASVEHPTLSIVLPTYNERENIQLFVPELASAFDDISREVLVVDDSSPDGTGEEVLALRERFPELRLITRREKTGIGSALRAGYHAASNDVILSSDTDLSFRAADLRLLYDAIVAGADLAIGSRHTARETYETPSFAIWLKFAVSRSGNALLKMIFRIPVHDFSANCRAIRRTLWERLDTKENTNFFLFEMILLAKRRGGRIVEIPVTFLDRRYGQSKINHIVEIPKAFGKMLVFFLTRSG